MYWDKIKYKIFKDLPVSHEVVWAFIIKHRKENYRTLQIQNEDQVFYRYLPLQRWKKTILSFDKIFLNWPRDSNVQSEPWMIEGAHTTRDRAMQLLHLHKTPSNYGERMILNNYKMAQILESLPLDFQIGLETLFDWQIQLTHQNNINVRKSRLSIPY